jgi:hypothetical protein
MNSGNRRLAPLYHNVFSCSQIIRTGFLIFLSASELQLRRSGEQPGANCSNYPDRNLGVPAFEVSGASQFFKHATGK